MRHGNGSFSGESRQTRNKLYMKTEKAMITGAAFPVDSSGVKQDRISERP
jgi:hypothetical protein